MFPVCPSFPRCRMLGTSGREVRMHSSLASRCQPFPWVRLAFIAAVTLLFSGWTCRAMFVSCQGAQPEITSHSPESIPSDAESVTLTIEGAGFTPQSQIMWNGNALSTTVIDSRHLQTTITQQTFESFGGSAGSSVQISVRSSGSGNDTGCPVKGNSAALTLGIS